ncbi:hypothetical protein IKJ53_06510 [bacterium]|nr:hypothetical protein [bacterium]
MIKKLLLIPLLILVSACENNGSSSISSENNRKANDTSIVEKFNYRNATIYENVYYEFNRTTFTYKVWTNDGGKYDVEKDHYYKIDVFSAKSDADFYTKDGKDVLKNQFVLETLELFVYHNA